LDDAAGFDGELVQEMLVELGVFFGMEAHRAIVAALDNVPRDAEDGEAGATMHGGMENGYGGAALAMTI